MKVLGITGGVGAGKSTVLDYLSRRFNARVIKADQAAHMLMEPGQSCYYGIVELFGVQILSGDQRINREKIAEIVFGDREKLEKLNRIVHPAVKDYIIREIDKERKENRVPFAAVEAALLIEDHYDTICDELWYIYTNDEVRKKRLFLSRGYDTDKTDRIIQNQLSDEEFRRNCQVVIDNSSDNIADTYHQIEKGLKNNEFV